MYCEKLGLGHLALDVWKREPPSHPTPSIASSLCSGNLRGGGGYLSTRGEECAEYWGHTLHHIGHDGIAKGLENVRLKTFLKKLCDWSSVSMEL